MLKSLTLKSVYDSSEHHLVRDLFLPLLKESKSYRRGVGYFTSGWLQEAAAGLAEFAENGGKAYFVTSPHLEQRDWDALKMAEQAKADNAVYAVIRSKVRELETTLREDVATALAWLVADGVLTFKFALPKNRVGDFHDKFGVFEDANGDRVAIHGSYNDSVHGLLNGESFSVFRSWVPEQNDYVSEHARRFERLWSGTNDFFRVYDTTDAIRNEIVNLRKGRSRPYKLAGPPEARSIRTPPEINLYSFQREAIDEWFAAGGRGLFEMATGTGKTFTALAAAAELSNRVGSLAVVVSAPFNHLVDQWRAEAMRFGFTPLLCRESSAKWVNTVRSRIQDFSAGTRKNLFLITTHKTGSEDKFTSSMRALRGETLYIADEVHYLGSPQFRRALMDIYKYRIGLSATPDRWFDEEGSSLIRSYFGSVVASMPLEQAIGPFLTPYRYVPHPVPLTASEEEMFADLSAEIGTLSARIRGAPATSRTSREQKTLELLLRQRADLIARAENKFPTLDQILREKIASEGVDSIHHTIVYCAPGETVTATRLLANLGLKAHEFVHTVPSDARLKILGQFEEADLQVLVAIKCLDEGVDIPATREAFFLASTSNPREFVQRRGRILRKHPGKEQAILHDMVVVPPTRQLVLEEDAETDRALMRRELPRFAEFSSAAENEFEARAVLFPILLELDLIHLLDVKPWEAYHQYRRREEYGVRVLTT
jgi:superfamily II DNA or RNA helicase